ncbi:MAG: protein translocase SEC61 complex subunit gamma [Thermoplasmata archaeon]
MDIVKTTWEYQNWLEEGARRWVKSNKYGRILKMARKPTNEEYTKTNYVCGAGIAIIGGIGFLIYWIWEYLPGHLQDAITNFHFPF